MTYFLLVFDRTSGTIVGDVAEFSNPEIALAERFRRELAERGHPDIEVVVLGAESREDLIRTHSRYFGDVGKLTVG